MIDLEKNIKDLQSSVESKDLEIEKIDKKLIQTVLTVNQLRAEKSSIQVEKQELEELLAPLKKRKEEQEKEAQKKELENNKKEQKPEIKGVNKQ